MRTEVAQTGVSTLGKMWDLLFAFVGGQLDLGHVGAHEREVRALLPVAGSSPLVGNGLPLSVMVAMPELLLRGLVDGL